MSEAFSHVAPVMPRRRLDPFVMQLVTAVAVFVTTVGVFAAFVVSHERAADARGAAARSTEVAEAEARASAAASPARLDPALARLLDGDARVAAERALELAQKSFTATSSWVRAAATDLARLPTTYLFVDGPSTSPQIVSVHVDGRWWAAAVLGTSGTCYWVSATTNGAVRFGTGTACTGQAALAADWRSWPTDRSPAAAPSA
jgi:hypothetical protein